MQRTYCNGSISERHPGSISERHPVFNSNGEKASIELKGSSFRNPKGIAASSDKALVLTVATVKGQGDFTTVQEAINAVPVNNTRPVVIDIKPGMYREKVTIPKRKPFITLSGSDAKSTIISWNDTARSANGTFFSATVTVSASDFIARDITIEGDQNVALKVSGDRSAFYNCRVLAYQDTLLDDQGRHYFRNCYIEGASDMICGNGKSIYQNCALHGITVNGQGAFTAQRRSSLSDDTGFVFMQCNLTGKGWVYLGRAWGPYSTVVFADTYMEDILVPGGWYNWSEPAREKTVYYVEYLSSGPGAARTDERVPWSYQISDPNQIGKYLNISYIDGHEWIKE
eukprot:PITA_23601